MTLLPREYKSYYEECAVTLPDGSTEKVAVRNYLLGENKDALKAFENKLFDHRKFDIDLRVNLVPVKSGTPTGTQLVSGGTLSFQQVHSMVQSAFTGKGSPEACQVVLQLAHQWKLAPRGLKVYAGELGLDCNGFVGNYLWHVIHKNDWTNLGKRNEDRDGPSHGISHYLDGRARVSRWEDLTTGNSYILGRVSEHSGQIIDYRESGDPGHIVITDPDRFRAALGRVPSGIGTVESTASASPAGLSEGVYSLVRMSRFRDVFIINRENVAGGPHQQLHFMIVRAPDPDPD